MAVQFVPSSLKGLVLRALCSPSRKGLVLHALCWIFFKDSSSSVQLPAMLNTPGQLEEVLQASPTLFDSCRLFQGGAQLPPGLLGRVQCSPTPCKRLHRCVRALPVFQPLVTA